MELIIGGAYQGKRAYATKKYKLTDEQIYTCSQDKDIAFGSRCIDRLEEFALYCVRNDIDATAVFRSHKAEWEHSVLICRDIFCGVVPMGAELRAWRDMTGRLCRYLAFEAQSVTRIYCGLEQKLK